MATRNRYPLHALGLILLFTLDYAASGQYSGGLSNIYKNAAQENQPLILLLDSSKNSDDLDSKHEGSDYSYKSQDYSSKKNYKYKDELQSLPSLSALLQNLGQLKSQNRHQPSKPDKQDHIFTRNKARNRNRDRRDRSNKLRLQSQLDKTDRDRRDDRENRNRLRLKSRFDRRDRRDRFRLRSQLNNDDRRENRDNRDYRERYDLDSHENRGRDDRDRPFLAKNDREHTKDDRNKRDRARDHYDRHDRIKDNRDTRDRVRDDRDRRDPDRDVLDRHDRYRDDNDRRDRNKEDGSVKAYIEKYYKVEKDLYDVGRNDKMDRALRTSVIKNILRAANDLNCDAQEECEDDCGGSSEKQDACEDKCEAKFECDDEKIAEDVEGCDLADSCLDSTGDNPSTRGIKFGAE